MGTTPIYGFPYPDPSDLVANYPAMGQELAEDIEAVLPTLGGLTKITDVTFTASANVSVNNCFSATYENYLLLARIDPTDNINIDLRLRAAGSDITTAAYNYSRITRLYSNSDNSTAAANVTAWQMNTTAASTLESVTQLTFHAPFLAKSTGYTSNIASEASAGGYNGMFYNTASATGFTIIASSGTLTGNLRVYGYKD